MDNPGIKNLGDIAISAAVTNQVITSGTSLEGVAQDFLDDLDGMQSANIVANFNAGNGAGSSAVLKVRTRFDGVNWIEVARFDFTNTNDLKFCTLVGEDSRTVTSAAALSAEGIRDGVLGSEWDAILTTTGTFGGNASISVRLAAR